MERTFSFNLIHGSQVSSLVNGLDEWHFRHGTLQAPNPDFDVPIVRNTVVVIKPGNSLRFSAWEGRPNHEVTDLVLTGHNPEHIWFDNGINSESFPVRYLRRFLVQLLTRRYSGDIEFFTHKREPELVPACETYYPEIFEMHYAGVGADGKCTCAVRVLPQFGSFDKPAVQHLLDTLERLSK